MPKNGKTTPTKNKKRPNPDGRLGFVHAMSCSRTVESLFLGITRGERRFVDLLLHFGIEDDFGTKLAMRAVASPASLCALDVIDASGSRQMRDR